MLDTVHGSEQGSKLTVTAPSFTAPFWAHLPRSSPLHARPNLDAAVQQRLAQAIQHWPSVRLEPARFLAHWAQRLPSGADAEKAFELLHVEDLYLACACAEGDPEGLRQLRTTLARAVMPVLRQVDSAPSFVDEMEQRLMERLLVGAEGRAPRISEYAGRGSLENWLRAAALRVALNEKRSQRRNPEQAISQELLVQMAAPSKDVQLDMLKARYRHDFNAAFGAAVLKLTGQERNLLRLHFVDALSLSQIGAVYQADKSTISRWISKTRLSLLHLTRSGLEARLGPAALELDSLMKWMDSQLDVSLNTALRSRR